MKLKTGSYLIRTKNLAGELSAVQKITVVSITKTCYEIQWENHKSWEEIAAFDSRVEIVEELESTNFLKEVADTLKKMYDVDKNPLQDRRRPPPYFLPRPRRFRPFDEFPDPYSWPWRITC